MGVSSLLFWLGVVGVVFALLNFVVAFAGTGFDPRGLDVLWIGGNLLVGIGLMLAAAFRDLDGVRARMRSGEARRAGKYGTSAVLATAKPRPSAFSSAADGASPAARPVPQLPPCVISSLWFHCACGAHGSHGWPGCHSIMITYWSRAW